jgi:hypothetical protein
MKINPEETNKPSDCIMSEVSWGFEGAFSSEDVLCSTELVS